MLSQFDCFWNLRQCVLSYLGWQGAVIMYLINSKSGIICQELELFRYEDKINNSSEEPIQVYSVSQGGLLKQLSDSTAEHHLQNRINIWVMALPTSPSFDPALSPTSGVQHGSEGLKPSGMGPSVPGQHRHTIVTKVVAWGHQLLWFKFGLLTKLDFVLLQCGNNLSASRDRAV